MRRWSILLLSSLTAAAIYACGGAPVTSNTSSDDTCPMLGAGLCPEGCHWDGHECRKNSGIIMEGTKADSGVDSSASE